jgi:N-glycosylase/DNA lyase
MLKPAVEDSVISVPSNPSNHVWLASRRLFHAKNYDLAATLASGQVFRWYSTADGGWEGVIGSEHLILRRVPKGIEANSSSSNPDWPAIQHYLQTEVNIDAVTATFPNDPPMQSAIQSCRGLRLLRQEPWECLASFILSSTKQIIQIQQIVSALCSCYGAEIPVQNSSSIFNPSLRYAFPSASKLASLSESQLRSCKMGFRAPYLLKTARMIASNELNLESLHSLPTPEARERLCALPGVGEKIANCVLLFAYGFQDAFPVDVWVQKAIRQLYFPKRKPTAKRLKKFVQTHFGPNAGYAQQYLFHYMRIAKGRRDEHD